MYSFNSSTNFSAVSGCVKLAVPIWTASAPAAKNSNTSSKFSIPPIPMIGISKTLYKRETQPIATGLIPIPEYPPWTMVFLNFPFTNSNFIEVPFNVFIALTASAPAFCAASPSFSIEVTFGVSFIIKNPC